MWSGSVRRVLLRSADDVGRDVVPPHIVTSSMSSIDNENGDPQPPGPPRLRRMCPASPGFTLVEIVLVLILLFILAAIAAMFLPNTTATRASLVARRMQSDIAYAQELAMSRNVRHRVYFNAAPAPVPNGYAVANDADGDGTWGEAGEFAANPVGGGNLSWVLNTGEFAGVTISAVTFAAPYVEFSGLGVPSSNGAALPGPRAVTINGGGANITVTVEQETGRVRSP